MNEEVRWKQRFANYQKAMQQLTKFLEPWISPVLQLILL